MFIYLLIIIIKQQRAIRYLADCIHMVASVHNDHYADNTYNVVHNNL